MSTRRFRIDSTSLFMDNTFVNSHRYAKFVKIITREINPLYGRALSILVHGSCQLEVFKHVYIHVYVYYIYNDSFLKFCATAPSDHHRHWNQGLTLGRHTRGRAILQA